jgi:hypothetical protein
MKGYIEFLNEAKMLRIKDANGKTVTNGSYITADGKSIDVTNWKGGKLTIKDGTKVTTFTSLKDKDIEKYVGMRILSVFQYNDGQDVSVGDIFVQYGNRFKVDKIDTKKDLIHTSQIFDAEITKQKPVKLRGVTSKRFNDGDIKKVGKF